MSWRNDRGIYNARRAAGRCVDCNAKMHGGGVFVRCEACRTRRNAFRRDQRRKWLNAGVCRTCGHITEQGHTRCAQCLADKRHRRSEPEKSDPRVRYPWRTRKDGAPWYK